MVASTTAGDKAERKRIIAQLHDGDIQRQANAARIAREIGGADMICGFADVLSSTNEWRMPERVRSPTGEMPQSCIVYLPPKLAAAMTLAQMVETPPAELKGKRWMFYTDADIEIWKKWWEKNKAQYEDKGK